MKKTLELICKQCNTTFVKELKEYTRQTKHGKTNFFCSRRCTGLYNTTNLPVPESNPWCYDKTHLQRMTQIAALKNTKYSNDDKPFQLLLRRTHKRYSQTNDLDIPYLRELWQQQNGRCAITNIPLDIRGKDPNTKASIDRIDSTKGYVKGNVRIVLAAVNSALGEYGEQEMLPILKAMVEAMERNAKKKSTTSVPKGTNPQGVDNTQHWAVPSPRTWEDRHYPDDYRRATQGENTYRSAKEGS